MTTEQELCVGDDVELCCGRTLRVVAVDGEEVTFELEGEGGPVLLCTQVGPFRVVDAVLLPTQEYAQPVR